MLTGTESTLKSLLIAQIEAAIGGVQEPNEIDGLAEGVANAIIPHLVTNVSIPLGIPVSVVDPISGVLVGTSTSIWTII